MSSSRDDKALNLGGIRFWKQDIDILIHWLSSTLNRFNFQNRTSNHNLKFSISENGCITLIFKLIQMFDKNLLKHTRLAIRNINILRMPRPSQSWSSNALAMPRCSTRESPPGTPSSRASSLFSTLDISGFHPCLIFSTLNQSQQAFLALGVPGVSSVSPSLNRMQACSLIPFGQGKANRYSSTSPGCQACSFLFRPAATDLSVPGCCIIMASCPRGGSPPVPHHISFLRWLLPRLQVRFLGKQNLVWRSALRNWIGEYSWEYSS